MTSGESIATRRLRGGNESLKESLDGSSGTSAQERSEKDKKLYIKSLNPEMLFEDIRWWMKQKQNVTYGWVYFTQVQRREVQNRAKRINLSICESKSTSRW